MSIDCARQHRRLAGATVLLLLLVIGVLATPSHAQVTTGTILGSITDEAGGVLPGATVTITNTDTGSTRTVPSGNDGTFLVSALPPGPYRVNVTLDGFRSFRREGLRLEVGQNARVDVRLLLGALTEEVVVTASAPLVDTRSSSVGMVVDSRRMEELPLLNRSTLSLAQLSPGISNVSLPQAVKDQRQGPSIEGGGSGSNQTNVQLDGAQFTSSLFNRPQNLPSPDSIQEFQVLTNSYSVEYGRASGPVMLAITKSGTNNVHGGLWEYFRNDRLNATNFFAPSKPVLRQNQFGGNLGGPLRPDRSFFFLNYEGLRIREQALLRYFSPTAAQRAGDFSASSRPIIDPLTGQPFPGNRIPLDRFDPMALAILDTYIPLPNQGAEVNSLVARPTDGNQVTLRVDHKLADPNNVSVRWHRNKMAGISGFSQIAALDAERGNLIDSWTISNTHIFGSALLGEGRVSFTTIESAGPASEANRSPRDLGGLYEQDGPVPLAPDITVSGAFTMSQLHPWLERSRFLKFDYKMSAVTGVQTIKFGVEGHRLNQMTQVQWKSSGRFQFTGTFTGSPLADFMIGRPTIFDQLTMLDNSQRSRTWAAFVQDDVRFGRLTVNLGLRFERFEPWEDDRGRLAAFRPGQQSTRFPNAPPGLVFPGDAGIEDGLHPPSNDFHPRVGLAWDVRGDGRTAVRAGYGLFSEVVFSQNASTSASTAPPFAPGLVFVPHSLSDPYRGRTSPFPLADPDEGEAVFPVPMTITTIAQDFRPGRVQQFNANIQQQIGEDLGIQVGYIGSRGRDLRGVRELNAAVFRAGATLANTQQRRPILPEYYASINEVAAERRSSHDSLQVSVTKRYSRGYTFQVAYALSRTMDDGAGGAVPIPQNPADLAAEWALSSFHRRHVLRVNGMWQLPSMQDRSTVVRHVLGGWRLAGIASMLSGSPFTVTSGADIALLGTGASNQRPNLVGDPELDGRSRDERIQRYFNTAAFARPAAGQFGNAPRNVLTGPGSFRVDASITKEFRPWQSASDRRIAFYAEAFNLFNTVNLGNPVANMNSPAFGRILTAGDARVVQLGLRFGF
jgi:hypothetical protein